MNFSLLLIALSLQMILWEFGLRWTWLLRIGCAKQRLYSLNLLI